jgi:hypothetical protein
MSKERIHEPWDPCVLGGREDWQRCDAQINECGVGYPCGLAR